MFLGLLSIPSYYHSLRSLLLCRDFLLGLGIALLFGGLGVIVRVQALFVVVGVQEVQGRGNVRVVGYGQMVGSALLRKIPRLMQLQHPVLVELSELKGLFLHVFEQALDALHRGTRPVFDQVFHLDILFHKERLL